jgi:hypothetical protein
VTSVAPDQRTHDRTAVVGPGPRKGFRWTRELIIYSIDLWHRKYLEAPTQDDWERAGPDHPCRLTVLRVFGTWNVAVTAAGLKARPQGMNRGWSRRRCPGNGRWCTCAVVAECAAASARSDD